VVGWCPGSPAPCAERRSASTCTSTLFSHWTSIHKLNIITNHATSQHSKKRGMRPLIINVRRLRKNIEAFSVSVVGTSRLMSRAGSAFAASPGGDEPWNIDLPTSPRSERNASKPISKEDALSRPDQVLHDAIARVTETHTAALRIRRGDAGADIGDLHVAAYDHRKCAGLLEDLTRASGLFCAVDANGDVREDHEKMNAFASEVLETCFEYVPTEEEAGKLASRNAKTAFQAVYKARAAREHIQEQCRMYVETKTSEEIILTRRMIHTARQSRKPPVTTPKGGLEQASFLVGASSAFASSGGHDGTEHGSPGVDTSHPDVLVETDTVERESLETSARGGRGGTDAVALDEPRVVPVALAGAFSALKFARGMVEGSRRLTGVPQPSAASETTRVTGATTQTPSTVYQKEGLFVPADPREDGVLGVTNRAIRSVRRNARTVQTILEYLLGYASVVDPEDMHDIDAASRGLRVSKGKSLGDFALKYAARLDATLPERHKDVLTRLVRVAAEEYHAHATLGADAEHRFETRRYDTAAEVQRRNREEWLRCMFPETPWPLLAPTPESARAVPEDGALAGALVNPTDPKSGIVQVDAKGKDAARKETRTSSRGSFPEQASRREPTLVAPVSNAKAFLAPPGDPGPKRGASTRVSDKTACVRPSWLYES